MKEIPNHLYEKIVLLSKEIKDNFRKKGIVIPIKNEDDTISLGPYTVIKDTQGFYKIHDYRKEVIVERINLPQTAIMLANGLALGKFLDTTLLNKDQKYGYALFEETLHKHKTKNIDLHLAKHSSAKAKREYYQHDINTSFEKLRKLV